ncbi:alpha/beta hydrolase family protein [Nitrospirillum sp. BR 11828]|uniref:alpha/beta hydrolase family protein n=1 Tax=Nitrospirillum sp. BR 11828 TaxID=3104325 RepID=UPI002ACA6584|nr:alpha/beta fold hydrolase [Nitrospirillum sp. BR 11828]MDZ5650618.1 alpha/beta fold hydrolase [Nitrospirillum sp. BR 11828]
MRRHPLATAALAVALYTLSVAMGTTASAKAPAGDINLAAQTIPAAIGADPAPDSQHPARMAVLHIPTGGRTGHPVEINGVAYLASGAGPHPTLLLLHGLPGNEKNLDLAQAVRRAGWNVVTLNYRGSWGSPGSFRFANNPEDAAAALAYLRDPAHAQELGIDTGRLVIAGHSMGAWTAVHTAAKDGALAGLILISMGDIGIVAHLPHDKLVALAADNRESLAGVTPESMAKEMESHADAFATAPLTARLTGTPLLALTSNDGLASHTDALVAGIRAHGGSRITTGHAATDHGWSDHRIALEAAVINWLQKLGN